MSFFRDISELRQVNQQLEQKTAVERVYYAFEHFPQHYALASSFGAQSAVSLHLLTQIDADIPVILIDTGHLFPETYQFIDRLTERLKLNLKVYRAELSSAWQEARYGQEWKQDLKALEQYNQRNKVEPMERALQELKIETWFAGLRRSQAKSRQTLPVVQVFKDRIKVHPIIDWDNQKLHRYLIQHQLPYHPLWDKGYVSIGDRHSTVPLVEGMDEEDTRFGGVKRECGLHLDTLSGL